MKVQVFILRQSLLPQRFGLQILTIPITSSRTMRIITHTDAWEEKDQRSDAEEEDQREDKAGGDNDYNEDDPEKDDNYNEV